MTPQPVRRFRPVMLLALALAAPAWAEIYKWTDAEGNVHFSDEAPDGAQKIELEPLPTMNLPMPTRLSDIGKSAKKQPGYEVLAVTKPANDAKLRDTDGSIPVTASIEPDLHEGHQLQVWVDGRPAGPAGSSTSLVAENVRGGERRLKVVVVDQDGDAVQSSAEVAVFIQQNTPDR